MPHQAKGIPFYKKTIVSPVMKLLFLFLCCLFGSKIVKARLDELNINLICNEPLEIKFRTELLSEEAKCVTFHSDRVPSIIEVLFQVESDIDTDISSDHSELASKFNIKLLYSNENGVSFGKGYNFMDSDEKLPSGVISSSIKSIVWDEAMNVDNVHFRKYLSSTQDELGKGFYQVSIIYITIIIAE